MYDLLPRPALRSRRAVLRGIAGACLSAGLPWSSLRAQSARRPLVDVHHHWYSAELQRWWGRDSFDPNWATAASLAAMDEAGVTTAMLSVTMPGVWKSNDVAGSVRLARNCNEQMAQTARDHPGRYGVIAALPLPQVDASLEEVRYALDVLHADAIGVLSNYESQYLGDPRFAPVLEELDRRRAVVYVHPMAPACCTMLVPGVGPGTLEAPTDTARTIESLLVTGTLSRLSGLQLVIAAGGGTLPFVGERMLNAAIQAGRAAPEPRKPDFVPETLQAALGRLYIDTAGVTNPADWAALMNFTTSARLLFGSDFPNATEISCLRQLRAMQQRFGLKAAEAGDIESGNAQRL
ncbi:MAG TPA: amidohydrolase family protein, partial [Steroidobacteraceae bacterium]|nr:amidohydrolase family protein [Steroidobacteraceae bacterium]